MHGLKYIDSSRTMINNTQSSCFAQRPDRVLPPEQVPLLMSDPFPSHLLTAILLQSLYCYRLSTMLDHSQQHTPTTDKVQNPDGVLLFDPPATPFAASPQQTTSPTPLTPTLSKWIQFYRQVSRCFHVAQPMTTLVFLTHNHASLPNSWPPNLWLRFSS